MMMSNLPNLPNRRAAIASLLLGASAAAAYAMTPRIKLAQLNGGLNLEAAIPREFGEWKMDQRGYGGIVNPQTEQLLKATYNQILTRTYVNQAGARVMLSIAYGEDQTDTGTELHHPEICYPAQGFQLTGQSYAEIPTPYGKLRTKRLDTSLGASRPEPVTYWIVVGREVALTGSEKRLAELRHGLRGEVVDGLLFRISTIDGDKIRAYSQHTQFTMALLAAVRPEIRVRLAGLQ
jgi:EpsI family protein